MYDDYDEYDMDHLIEADHIDNFDKADERKIRKAIKLGNLDMFVRNERFGDRDTGRKGGIGLYSMSKEDEETFYGYYDYFDLED